MFQTAAVVDTEDSYVYFRLWVLVGVVLFFWKFSTFYIVRSAFFLHVFTTLSVCSDRYANHTIICQYTASLLLTRLLLETLHHQAARVYCFVDHTSLWTL